MQTVAGYVADPSHAPQWYRDIESVEWKTEPPVQVGSRLAFAVKFRRRTRVYTYEVTELEPDERLVMRSAEGPFRMETTYTWASAGAAATRMTLRNRGEPAGFSAFAAPVMASAIRRANRADLARLKSLLEGDEASSDESVLSRHRPRAIGVPRKGRARIDPNPDLRPQQAIHPFRGVRGSRSR